VRWAVSRPSSYRHLAALLGCLCIFFIILVASLQWRSSRYQHGLVTAIGESNRRHQTTTEYLSHLRDVETGERGYVVTGNREFLQPWSDGISKLPPTGSQLKVLYSGHRKPALAIGNLVHTGEAKVRFSNAVVSLRDAGGQDKASALIASGLGKRLMDHARVLVAGLERAEQDESRRLLLDGAEQQRDQQRLILMAEAVLLAAAVALLTALLATVWQLDKSSGLISDYAKRQEAIFESASDAMMMLDRNGDIVSLNTAAEKLFGRRREELHRRSNLVLFDEPPSRQASQEYLAALSTEGKIANPSRTFIGRRSDGSKFETEVVTTPVRLHDGLHFLTVGRDITERRRVERMKTDFVATVSHELRTPLTSISGSLGLLAGGAAGELGDKARRFIDIALSNSQQLIRLINDMLDIEKIEAGKMIFDSQPLDLEPMLQKVIQANAGFALKHRVEVQLLFPVSTYGPDLRL
jgi:PAS domain S-box-containing protein